MTDSKDIEELIGKVALGDRAALTALYDATNGKLFSVCLRVLKSRAEAEDALQDVYLRIWSKADRYAVTGHSPMTWLITVARNLSIDRLRARKKGHVDLENAGELVETRPGPEAASISASEQRRISACFEELPPDRPDLFWQQGPFLTDDPPLVPGSAFRGCCRKLDSWHVLPSDPPSKPGHQHHAGKEIVPSLAMAAFRGRSTALALHAHSAALSPFCRMLHFDRMSAFGGGQ